MPLLSPEPSMSLQGRFGDGGSALAIGIGVAVLAGAVVLGIVAGGSGSGQGAGPTGPSGPGGAKQADRNPPRRHKPHPKPKEVPVPNVVGDTEATAHATLLEHGLRGGFTKPGQSDVALVCGGAAPGATVISQFPGPGGKAREGQNVGLLPSAYAQTGCGHSSATRQCDPSELSLDVGESKPDYTGGGDDSLAIVKVVHARGESPCGVDSTLTLALARDDAGPLTEITGNPMTLQMHASLEVDEMMVAGWLIGNWCGSRHGVLANASVDGLEAGRAMKELPYGDDCPTISLYSLYKDRRPETRN